MTACQGIGIGIAFGDRDVLKDVNITLTNKTRIALSGANGSGKSTLMKILAGVNKPDTGVISTPNNVRNYYLPQSGIVFQNKTLREEAEEAYKHIVELIKKMDEIGHELTHCSQDKHDRLLEEYNELHETITDSGYYNRDGEITKVLQGLGFNLLDFNKKSSDFSGGWQMRIALAKALLMKPSLLLLDEPTNYLDIEARDWLGSFLKNFSGGILIVSHDRFFLDQVVDHVAELFNGTLKLYKGNYTKYESLREIELEELLRRYKKQEEEIAKHENFIRRFKSKASKATQAQSHVKQLEKIERIEIPASMKKMKIEFPKPPHSGKKVVEIEGLSKSYGEHKVINNLDILVEKGEKIVIAGQNGAGKSTLLRMIAGVDSNYTGEIKLGTDVKVGYFSQDHGEKLNDENSILEELESESPLELIPKLRGLLGAFLFQGDDVFKQIKVLSGGEKNRVSLLKLLLKPFNLLILDEPTNHLDLGSKDVLLDALKDYEGTLLFVSHDRYFIERLADKVLHLENGTHKIYLGDYNYYRWKRDEENSGITEITENKEVKQTVLSRDEDKKLKNLIQKLERQEVELLDKIEKQGEKLSELQNMLGLEENYSDPVKATQIQSDIKKCQEIEDKLGEEWEATLLELEEAREKRGN
ncbi:MAG: ABC-F family ATP-binding cassette domain-containing protein [Spirochaetales bacterium]|nr:ABC-F family ATP-binding cassette domain-containing protein [Spirochaetales bacterium]